MLFAQSMLENSPTKPQGRTKDLVVSLTVHGILLAALFLVPLCFTEAIDLHQFNSTLLVAPPAPPPAPPPASAAVARRPAIWKKVLPITSKLVAPRVIPSPIVRSSEKPGGTDLAAGATGVSGGVPGGQLGGVIGGILTGARDNYIPLPPAHSAPKRPIRVGGEVKAPRLIVRVEPIYPPLLKKARVSGDVVIDAVIDTQGNVVEMHAVSGERLLIPPAMDALRRWKYEPTVLGGQAFPVELQVTIEFRLT
jgi:protein TonB